MRVSNPHLRTTTGKPINIPWTRATHPTHPRVLLDACMCVCTTVSSLVAACWRSFTSSPLEGQVTRKKEF
jgi:hypothetical protein